MLPELTVLSHRCSVRRASSIAESTMDEWSQVSVKISAQQSFTVLFVETCSLSPPILLTSDLVFARKMLGSGGLSGLLRSLASAPAMRPRLFLLWQRRLHLLWDDKPRSTGAPSNVCRNVMGADKLGCNSLLCNLISRRLCRL